MLISGLMLVMSLLVLGFGAFLAANLGAEFADLELAEFQNPVVFTIVFGAGLLIFSLTGLVGSCKEIKCLLFIFLIGSMVMALGVLASGAALLAQSGALDKVGEAIELNVADSVEFTVLHINLALFENCCVLAADRCNANPTNAAFCVAPDGERIVDIVDEFLGDNIQTCDTLISFGLVIADECVDEETFVNAVTVLLDDNIVRLGTANVVAGVIMFLLLFCTCYLLWTTKDDEKKKQKSGCC